MATEADIPQIIHTTIKEGEVGDLSDTLKLELNEIGQDETRKAEQTHKEIINSRESEDMEVETNINVDTAPTVVGTVEDNIFSKASSFFQGVFHDAQKKFGGEEKSTKTAEESNENLEEILKTTDQTEKEKNLSQIEQITCEEDLNLENSEYLGGVKQDQDSIAELKETEEPEISNAVDWIKENNQLEDNKIAEQAVQDNVARSSKSDDTTEELPKVEKLEELKAAEPNTESIEKLDDVDESFITTTDKKSVESVNEKETKVTESKEEEKNPDVENIEIVRNLVEKSSSVPHVYEEETGEEIIHKVENPESKMQPESFDLVSDTYESQGVNVVTNPVEDTKFAENENIQIQASDIIGEKEDHAAESQNQDPSDEVSEVQVLEKCIDPEVHANVSSKDVEMVNSNEELPESTEANESSHVGELQTYSDAMENFEGENLTKETFVEDSNASIVTKKAILSQENFEVGPSEDVETEKPDNEVIEENDASETISTNEIAQEVTVTTREDQDTIKPVIEESAIASDKECIPQSIEQENEQESSHEVQKTEENESDNTITETKNQTTEEIAIANSPSSASGEITFQESFEGEKKEFLESTEEILNSDRGFTNEDIKDGTESDATSADEIITKEKEVTPLENTIVDTQMEHHSYLTADKPTETLEEQVQIRDESNYLEFAEIEKDSENEIVIPEGEKLLKPEFEDKIEDQSLAINGSTEACETSADIKNDILDEEHSPSDFKSSLEEDVSIEKEVDELVAGGQIQEAETPESGSKSTVKDEEIDDDKTAPENSEIEETAQLNLSSPATAEQSLGEEVEPIMESKDEVTNTDRELLEDEISKDLVKKITAPYVLEKETGEEIEHETEPITTAVTEATTPEELDSVDTKHSQVSEFDESTNLELIPPKISDERDIPTDKNLRDFVLEQEPKVPHATSSSEHAVLPTEEVCDEEQHIPAQQTEEGITDSGTREDDDAVLFSNTEDVKKFDDQKLNVEAEKDKTEDTVNKTSNEAYQTFEETEHASKEQVHSATNAETSIKEDEELYTESVELKAGEIIQEVEVSEPNHTSTATEENQDSVEAQEQPSSDFEQVTVEKSNEGVPISDDANDTATIPRDFDLGEYKNTLKQFDLILTEAKEGADESEEKPDDDKQQETSDKSLNTEDATVERSSVEDSSAILLEDHNHVTAEASNIADEPQENVKTSPVSTYAPSSADTMEDKLLQEQTETQSPRDGAYLASLDTKENSINDDIDKEIENPVVDAPNKQVNDSEITENPEVTTSYDEKTQSQVAENEDNKAYSETDTLKETLADNSSEFPVESTSEPNVFEEKTGEEILHEPEIITTGVTEKVVLEESDCADVKDAEVLESDENRNVETLTPEISGERAVSTSEISRDFVLEQDPKEPYATSSSESAVLPTEEVHYDEQPIPAQHTEAGDVTEFTNTEQVENVDNEKLLNVEAEISSEDSANKTLNEVSHTSVETEQASLEQENSATNIETRIHEDAELLKEAETIEEIDVSETECASTVTQEKPESVETQEQPSSCFEPLIEEKSHEVVPLLDEIEVAATIPREFDLGENKNTEILTEAKGANESDEIPDSDTKTETFDASSKDEREVITADISSVYTTEKNLEDSSIDLLEAHSQVTTEASEPGNEPHENIETSPISTYNPPAADAIEDNLYQKQTELISSTDEACLATSDTENSSTNDKFDEEAKNLISDASNEAFNSSREIETETIEVKDSELKQNPEVTTSTDKEETEKCEAAETETPKVTPADETSEDLGENTSVPRTLEKEIGEEILHEPKTITTGAPESETLEVLDRSDIKHAQVSDFDDNKSVEILAPEISGERDFSAGETLRDTVVEHDHKEVYATSVSDDAVLTTEEVQDGEQHVPAQPTEENIHEPRNVESLGISEAGEVTELSNTEQVEKVDDEKLLDVEAEKGKPEDPVNKTSIEAGSGETEQAREEQEHSATNVETSIKEDAELFSEAVELKAGETTQEAEILETTIPVADENKEYVETLEQPRSEFEPVVEEKTDEVVSLSDDIYVAPTVVLNENKSTEILTEAKESEEKPEDDRKEEACDTSSIIEDEREVAIADRSFVATTEQNLNDSSAELLDSVQQQPTSETTNQFEEILVGSETIKDFQLNEEVSKEVEEAKESESIIKPIIEEEIGNKVEIPDQTPLANLENADSTKTVTRDLPVTENEPELDMEKDEQKSANITSSELETPEEKIEEPYHSDDKTEIVPLTMNQELADLEPSAQVEYRTEQDDEDRNIQALHETKTEEAIQGGGTEIPFVVEPEIQSRETEVSIEKIKDDILTEQVSVATEKTEDTEKVQDDITTEHQIKLESNDTITDPAPTPVDNLEASAPHESTETAKELATEEPDFNLEQSSNTQELDEDRKIITEELIINNTSPVSEISQDKVEDESTTEPESCIPVKPVTEDTIPTEVQEEEKSTRDFDTISDDKTPEVTKTSTDLQEENTYEVEEPKYSDALSQPEEKNVEDILDSHRNPIVDGDSEDKLTYETNPQDIIPSEVLLQETLPSEKIEEKNVSESYFAPSTEKEACITNEEPRELEGSDLKLESIEDRVGDSPHEAEKEESVSLVESINNVDFPAANDDTLDIAKTAESDSKKISEEDTLYSINSNSEALDFPGTSSTLKEISTVEVDETCQGSSTPDFQKNEDAFEAVAEEKAEETEEKEMTEPRIVAKIKEPEVEEHQTGIANESITNEIVEKKFSKDSAVASPDTETAGKDVPLTEEYSKVENIQELDSITKPIDNEELPEVLQTTSLDENKQEQVLGHDVELEVEKPYHDSVSDQVAYKEPKEEEEMSYATEAPNTGATALNEEVKHEEEKKSEIKNEALNIPDIVEDAQAGEAAPKVLPEVEEICEDPPRELYHEKLQTKDMSTFIDESTIDIPESLEGLENDEKPENKTLESTLDARDTSDDLNLKERSIYPSEEPSNIISEKQISTQETVPEEVEFNQNETELTKDKEKVEEFDESKIHSTESAYGDTKIQDNDSSVDVTEGKKVDLVSDKDVTVKSFPEVQQVPEKQIIQESEVIKSADASVVEPKEEIIAGKTQTEETKDSNTNSSPNLQDRSLIIEQKEEKEITTPTEEENEDEHEHERVDSGSDGPVMVEASTDVLEKATPHKKSHNILSGVGSKVKHSIAKVRKVITGKSSHPKPSSPK